MCVGVGEGEETQLVICVPCKYKDLSLILVFTYKSQIWCPVLIIFMLGNERQADLRGLLTSQPSIRGQLRPLRGTVFKRNTDNTQGTFEVDL